MAGLEALTAYIYHERQQTGSMLCAQHALNSLLQGNYFTAPDLAAIANSFDELEQNALRAAEQHSTSTNMDDSGFFSVQVIERALEVWGLNLVRWRSEQMRPFQASPQTQLAFVLNLNQHWFTLRRFGPARTDPASDPGEGHWYNLNSQYTDPKWVSRTYLGMFLQQSEEEGYSVFAVVQADPSKPLALPRTEADNVATSLDAPDSMPGHSSLSMPGTFPDDPEVVIPEETDYDVEDEDIELQAALAASITGEEYIPMHDTYVPRLPVPAPELRQAPVPPNPFLRRNEDSERMDVDEDMGIAAVEQPSPSAHTDPVAASMERSRMMLAQMRRAQEAALRETYTEEVPGAPRAVRARRQEEIEEAEAVRRAILSSMREHSGDVGVNDDDEGDGEWLPEEKTEEDTESASSSARRRGAVRTDTSGASSTGVVESVPPSQGQERVGAAHRVYDDEDAELQAALRASLETMPEGFVHPPTPPRRQPTLPGLSAPATVPVTPSSETIIPAEPKRNTSSQSEETDEDHEDDATGSSLSPVSPTPPQVDVEEMRRRRLARFGGQS
ncbi:hypothetical protein M0805_005813 [Coniferiporia weirii]|nr:hypothetical protein M0805_005813 [Coniferiporia weirii]